MNPLEFYPLFSFLIDFLYCISNQLIEILKVDDEHVSFASPSLSNTELQETMPRRCLALYAYVIFDVSLFKFIP